MIYNPRSPVGILWNILPWGLQKFDCNVQSFTQKYHRRTDSKINQFITHGQMTNQTKQHEHSDSAFSIQSLNSATLCIKPNYDWQLPPMKMDLLRVILSFSPPSQTLQDAKCTCLIGHWAVLPDDGASHGLKVEPDETSKDKSVYICSVRPHWMAGWKACSHRARCN